ncbi:actin-binding Rho-activating protein-like [Latimeria chalumnae]|uniref:actin-binding Rho-activating protein-like n=1 Tax=Latimeria chalumnae TaxID=7897 RepID=UPI0003C1A494
MSSIVVERKPFMVGAIKKTGCSMVVGGLARRWQEWASERSAKQQTVPRGWVPTLLPAERKGSELNRPGEELAPKVTEKQHMAGGARMGVLGSSCGSGYKMSPSYGSKGEDCRVLKAEQELLQEKMERDSWLCRADTAQIVPRNTAAILGEACSEGRQLHNDSTLKQTPPAQIHTRKEKGILSSKSSSLDTEDSGFGEEGERSEREEENRIHKRMNKTEKRGKEEKTRKRVLPRVKVLSMMDVRNTWQKWSEEHMEKQKLNPFSAEFDYEYAMAVRLQKGDEGYGRPKEGSKTAERAHRAHKHIQREMEELCFIIRDTGVHGKDGRARITFGRLFERYIRISDKVVGILLRARKHGMLLFEGEMLWQGKDDNVVITLLV